MLIVPETITTEIATFVESLVPGQGPSIIRVEPDPGARRLSCWQNVSAVCRDRGGRPVKGWRIWWIPDILIEAQAHVVWRSPDGLLVDLTPNDDGELTCVFVPDPQMIEQPGVDFVASQFHNIRGELCVEEYIRCAQVVAKHKDDEFMSGRRLPAPPEEALLFQSIKRIQLLHQGLF